MTEYHDIGFLIKLIHDGIDRVFHLQIGKNGPTRSQLSVLDCLLQHEGEKVFVKDIMDCLHIDQSTASGIIKRMEGNGYITCSQDPDDRRQKIITLRLTGKEISIEKAHQGISRIESTLLSGLTEAEQNELRRMLNVVYQNLSNQ